ncbi:hypothetical protein AURDEDRAFT_184368 [Auricularia subglabra TFB-10046 SS5]|nr:hypothetical protein AURDEDRAFT_184368 [Auricularia subglabra TFB-10046 SS5]
MDASGRERHFIGPVLLAGFVQSLLQGLFFSQVAHYYHLQGRGLNDDRRVRAFVALILVLGTLQTCQTLYHVWQVMIFGSRWVVVLKSWGDPALNTVVTSLVQAALVYRCSRMTRNARRTLITLGMGIVLETLAGIALFTCIIAYFDGIVPSFIAWMTITVGLDLTITVILLYHLLQQRTGVHALDSVIFRVARIAIESALPCLVCIALSLTFSFYINESSLMFLFLTCTGKMYCHALLTTLNSRADLRDRLDQHRAGNLGRLSLRTSAFAVRQDAIVAGGNPGPARPTRHRTSGLTTMPTSDSEWHMDVSLPQDSSALDSPTPAGDDSHATLKHDAALKLHLQDASSEGSDLRPLWTDDRFVN